MIQSFLKILKQSFWQPLFILFIVSIGIPAWSQTYDTSFPDYNDFGQSLKQKVATIGNINISAKEFILSYEFGPAFLKRLKDSKQRYLDVMIYEKLLALDGYKQDIHLRESVIRSCRAFEEDIMTEELFRDEIMHQVSVTKKEIENVIPLEQINLSLKWLYQKEESDIIERRAALHRGIPFDSLFSLQLNDSTSVDDRSLESTFFRLQMKNPVLAAIVDTLTLDKTSAPIRAADGWYIVRKDNVWNNIITTETALDKLKYELERAIFKQKLDKLSDIYVNNLMNQQDPVIEKKTFGLVVKYINDRAVHHEPYSSDALKKGLKQPDLDTHILDYGKYDDHILVRSKSGNILFKDYINWYLPRMAYLKFNSTSSQRFILTVQQTVWRMVRDYLLIQRARELKYDEKDEVRAQVGWWRDKIIFNAVKADIANSIKFDEADLSEFYNNNIKNYVNSANDIIPFEKAKKNVRSDFVKETYMNKLMHRVLKLKQDYEIYIDKTALDNLQVDDEENPKAIDLYAVKKGGLLPRQPVPTIDWEWQLWY